MSTYNAVGDFGLNELLARRLNTPGGASAPGVAPELFPCLVLESDRIEWGYIKGERRYGSGFSVGAGGAGTRASVTVVNARIDTLVVIERIRMSVASGNGIIRVGGGLLNSLPFGTNQGGRPRDTREPESRRSVTAVIQDNTLGSSTAPAIWFEPSPLNYENQIVLGPGGFAYCSPEADNVAITNFAIAFRERGIQPGELR